MPHKGHAPTLPHEAGTCVSVTLGFSAIRKSTKNVNEKTFIEQTLMKCL